MEKFKTYYHLTKPGIIRGNVITAVAGFLLASNGNIDLWLLLATVLGIALIIACGCVINNFIDKDIDKKMERTKGRALVTGTVSETTAIIYGSLLGILGFGVLAKYTNTLTVIIGLIGLFDYLVLYGIGKRQSIHGTLIGSISGAMPPVAGYTAVTNSFDGAAVLLFLILVIWQMPHFYSIAIYRLKDYKKAGIPVISVVRGVKTAKLHILIYIGLFTLTAPLLTVFGYTGYTYLIIMILTGGFWLWMGLKGYKTANDDKWAHTMFGYSLLALMIFSVLISLNSLLP